MRTQATFPGDSGRTSDGPEADHERDEKLRDLAKYYAGPADVLCLTVLAQPLVDELQNVVRYQRRLLEEAAQAIEHTLCQVREVDLVRRRLGSATETYHLLTGALAAIRDHDVDRVRDSILPGSAALHRDCERGDNI